MNVAKQNYVWRQVAAAMAEPEPAAARRHLEPLANPPSSAVVTAALRLCRSARADERRAGALLADLLLERPDLDQADALRAARQGM